MKLQFKEVGSYKTSKNSPDVYFSEAIGKIREMAKLYNIPSLKDEALIKVASQFYDLKLENSDYPVLARMALKTRDLDEVKIATNIEVSLDGEEVKLKAVGYRKKGLELDQNRVYTKDELLDLIASGHIVISFFLGHLQRIGDVTIPGHSGTVEEFRPINGISLNNLGKYQKYLITSIKRKLPLDRLARDVEKASSNVRRELQEYRSLLQEKMDFLVSSYNAAVIEDMIMRDYDLAMKGSSGYYDRSVFTSSDTEYGVTPSFR